MAQWTGGQTLGPVSRGRGRNTAALIRNGGAARGRDNGHPLRAAASLLSERRETSGGGGAGRLECPTGVLCLSKPPAPPAGRLARAGIPEGGALQGWPASRSICRIPPTTSGTSMFESRGPGRRWRTGTTSGGSRRQPATGPSRCTGIGAKPSRGGFGTAPVSCGRDMCRGTACHTWSIEIIRWSGMRSCRTPAAPGDWNRFCD